ncbi:MAG: 5-methyltetrahydropteroyltriglutamate--homocysteine methyltransferase [Desulfonauticus sp.]|nr:5-methyltetrahydropteroyltriglutamate--homocysteine methyltransferase [Desulfonauticus sp.]
MKTLAFGFPKLGENREFKKIIESYWNNLIDEKKLSNEVEKLKLKIAKIYTQKVDIFPSNEVSLYDFMLDTTIMLGAIPKRFKPYQGLSTYFEMAKGKKALELTKWFNTNYHYLVPEIEKNNFFLFKNFPLEDFIFYKNKGYNTLPKLIGPFTFLTLSKVYINNERESNLNKIEEKSIFENFFKKLIPVYNNLLKKIFEFEANLILIEEPAFVMELETWKWKLIKEAYKELSKTGAICVLTYYDSVSEYKNLIELPVKGIGLDLVSNSENLENILKFGFPDDKYLVAGIINGRQVWKANLKEKLILIEKLSKVSKNLIISNSCPLYHLPISLEGEKHLASSLKEKLSFAKEKLEELNILKKAIEGNQDTLKFIEKNEKILNKELGKNEQVRQKIIKLSDTDFKRETPYTKRIYIQKNILKLPLLPTTTIGSFPQTEEVRKMRAKFNKGEISEAEYKLFIKEKIKETIELQEKIGLDVLVHGEFERTDMVEFFAQKLEGIATTKNGWILSYGTRGYRPSIIYGDVFRTSPLTLEEISYAQSLTQKPVKGMLTGPVTILNWSYYREDISKEEIAYQIALALWEEVKDLEKVGIKIIQIDEPAFREGAPIKRKDWKNYFNWAIKAFKLCSRAKPETQIHTHMCYSDFNEIIDYIYQMDFDVISIEASRSKGEILEAFENYKNWDRQIGIGVYDIHSPAIPTKEEIREIIERALKIFPKELLWINPDCGLKTRKWEEVIPALKNMVTISKNLRKEL